MAPAAAPTNLSQFPPHERRSVKHELEVPVIKAVIIAAGEGSHTDTSRPLALKCLQHFDGVAVLERTINASLEAGVTAFVFVLGFQDERIRKFVQVTFPDLNADYVHYPNRSRIDAEYSLSLAEPYCRSCDFITFNADVLFDTQIISRLLSASQPNCLCIDQNIQSDTDEIRIVIGARNLVFKANKSVAPETAVGRLIGIEKIGKAAARLFFADLASTTSAMSRHQEFSSSPYERLIAKGIEFHTVDITGLNWLSAAKRAESKLPEKVH